MTNEERDLIARFVARVGGAPQGGGFLGGSVPSSTPALPPIDREADDFIGQQFQKYPEARYRMTQTALVQEAALGEAQNRIQRLQWELDQAKQALQQAPQAQGNKGFFSSIFGGGSSAPAPAQQRQQQGGPWGQQQGYGGGFQPSSAPPQPQYMPNYQPGMFQRGGGSGFLGSALTTAAGVAGGMVVGNALMNAFSGHGGGWGQNAANTVSSPGSLFDGGGVTPTDPTGGYDSNASFSDPFGGGGVEKDFGGGGSLDTNTSWDGGGFDQGGGGFDAGGGGGFDGGGFDDNNA